MDTALKIEKEVRNVRSRVRLRVALDVRYVLNWSPWMDIWILFRTVGAVLFMKGAR